MPQGTAEDYTNAASRFGEVFDFLPSVAYLAIIVDLMVFASAMLLGFAYLLSLAWSVPIGVVMGLLAWRMQMKMGGDDNETALIKGAIVGLLTAIPAPFTPILLYFVRKTKT